MPDFDTYLDYEEDFQPQGKRESRKKRQERSARDRSKYKKTDQNQKHHPQPSYEMRGRVLHVSPEVISVSIDDAIFRCSLKGALKKERTKHKNLIAVGDWVHVENKGDHSGVIVHIEPRTSYLARADNLSRRKKQLIAVNIDQVFIVTSLIAPKFKPFLIDRYVLSAKKGNMNPIILINKMDLLSAPSETISALDIAEEESLLKSFLQAYQPLDIPIVTLSVSTQQNLDVLHQLMHNKTSVFAGQSGVGKSSLINAAIGTSLPVGDVAKKTGKGSHTTTAAQLIPLEQGGFCVDTPGIKSFGVYDISIEDILLIFPDFAPFAAQCRFPNCSHLHEPDCAIQQALADKHIHPLRYQSYTVLMQESPPKEWE